MRSESSTAFRTFPGERAFTTVTAKPSAAGDTSTSAKAVSTGVYGNTPTFLWARNSPATRRHT